MTSRLTGMGLLTHVQHPLERLGDLVEAERQRQRALVFAERLRILRAGLAGASVGASIFGTAVMSFAMLTAGPEISPAAAPQMASVEMPMEQPAPPQFASTSNDVPTVWPQPVIEGEAVSRPASFESVTTTDESLRPQPGVSLQAQAMASFGEPLPRDATALATLAADVTLDPAEATPRDEVRTQVASLETARPLSTLVLSGLPQGSSVEHGVDMGDGTMVIPGDKSSAIDVKLPARVREPVRAEVEMIGPDGVLASEFALTIRPSSGAPGRVQRAMRTDNDEEPKKSRRKKRARGTDEKAASQPQVAQSPRADERGYPVEPSYLGRGDRDDGRRQRRDRSFDEDDSSLSRSRRSYADDEPAPQQQSKGWSLFGLFGQ